MMSHGFDTLFQASREAAVEVTLVFCALWAAVATVAAIMYLLQLVRR